MLESGELVMKDLMVSQHMNKIHSVGRSSMS